MKFDDDDENNIFIQWLSKKDQSSTVFLCFGSEYFLSTEQKTYISYGLELNRVNLIWVIKFPGGERKEIEEVVLKGFLERTKERDGGGGVGSTCQDFRPFEYQRACESLWGVL